MIIILLTGILLLITIIFLNILRVRQKYQFKLKPNCLLTQHPIVFISGKRSIFYFGNYWNFIPQLLREHGYDVRELNLAWRNPTTRMEQIKDFIQNLNESLPKYHFIADKSAQQELEWLATEANKHCQSCWLVQDQSLSNKISVHDLFPHRQSIQILALTPNETFKTFFLWKVLISLHNFILAPTQRVIPCVLALPGVNNNMIAHKYINFAISLAESEV